MPLLGRPIEAIGVDLCDRETDLRWASLSHPRFRQQGLHSLSHGPAGRLPRMRKTLGSQLDALLGAHQTLPWLLHLYLLVPFVLALTTVTGLLFTLPTGPLCDEGMVLFMEGGCDWGESNIFFFAKLNLLFAANLAFALCLRRREAPLAAWLPHLVMLCCLGGLMWSGGSCDTYYAHPNGSMGQMVLELAAFSALGIALLRPLAHRSRSVQLLVGLGWNAAHVGAFYLWLGVTDHWTWTHTALLCATLLAAAMVVLLTTPSPAQAPDGGAADLRVPNP
ncbi:hypothetical protein [Pyxidicoccus xibeiensis]|uniref:hypothetical protein n=1 Tax=Pyxidicoccus xibeiensis TaxID=2906759 RepID=UPI0020A784E6|nr:hypothetical protein [Pyxidicoccus xibeiensis]MCP3140642.1 hypothetical protein [Pyxidicoccus xibeiensis]